MSTAGSDPGAPREIARAQEQLFASPGGARAKYAALVVGRPGWGALLKHECVVLLSQHVPGALGLALRKWLYPTLLGACGRNVIFGQNVVLRHPHKIHVGDNVMIDDHCLLDAKGTTNHGIRIGSGVFVGRNTILSCKNGDITLESGANLGFNCEVFSASDVRIGQDTLVAAYCYLVGGGTHPGSGLPTIYESGRIAATSSRAATAWTRPGASPGSRRRASTSCRWRPWATRPGP